VVEEAHAGLACADAAPSRVSARTDVRSRRSCVRSWPSDSWAGILPHARLHGLGVHVEALGAGDRRAGRCQLAGGPLDAHLAHPAAEMARRELDAKRAEPPVGSTWLEPAHNRRTRSRSGPRQRRSRRSGPAERAPPFRPRSAADAQGRGRSRARAPGSHRGPARSRTLLADGRALHDEVLEPRRERIGHGRGGGGRGDKAALTVLSLGEHVERGQTAARPPAHPPPGARADRWPGEAVDADVAESCCLASCT